jgi:hypothetical protein
MDCTIKSAASLSERSSSAAEREQHQETLNELLARIHREESKNGRNSISALRRPY